MPTPDEIKQFLKAEAQSLGFVAMGVSVAHPVPQEVRDVYEKEVHTYGVGDMTYLLRNEEVRFNPDRLVEGAKSIIVFAFNYYPPILQEAEIPQVAYFAYGEDYHRVLKDKLYILLDKLKGYCKESFKARPFVDSAPLAERFWAREAGVGRRGKNGLIIVPRYGSFCFLSEIVTTLYLPPDRPLTGSPCGRCSRCIDACPAKAIQSDGSFIATRCISYQTIERHTPFGKDDPPLSTSIFGCDICQKVCPHNQKLSPHREARFLLSDHLRVMQEEDWRQLSSSDFDTLFGLSPIHRSGHEGILRNLEIFKGKKEEK